MRDRQQLHTDGRKLGPAHRALAQRIGVAIATGRHPPDTLLPNEMELAETFGVARSVVREALRNLAAKGMIESRPKVGTRVRRRQHWSLLDPELLGWMFDSEPPLPFVRSLYQLRMIIEPAACELAAISRTAGQLRDMRDALDIMERDGLDDERGRAADHRFHAIILEATGNELLVTLSAGIAASVRWTTFFKYRHERKPRDPIPHHRDLFAAIADQDAKAAGDAARTLVRQAQLDTEAAMSASGDVAADQ